MHEIQWLIVFLRVLHVVAAAMWIGASFYIISWENKFNRTKGLATGIEGNFWTIQGGDFYYVEKLRDAPSQLPEELHWFKYEAYVTWLSGFALMCLVFYLTPGSMLISDNVFDISGPASVAISLGSLLACWLAYDLYCRTPLAKNFQISAILGLLLVGLFGYLFSLVFSQRAAFIHVGAVMGTIMSANVFFVIIPWHKRLIRAIDTQQSLEELFAARPGFRSRHNHYMTLPVFFIMLGSHFPVAFNQPYSWVLLTAIVFAAGLLKHYHNLLQQKAASTGYLLAGVGILAAVIFATAPASIVNGDCGARVSTEQAYAVVAESCRTCHSIAPTDATWTLPPIGVVFDTPEQVLERKNRILQRAIVQQDMPPHDVAQLSLEQRNVLGCWAKQ